MKFFASPTRGLICFAVLLVFLGSALPAKADSITIGGTTFPQLQAFINITSLTGNQIMFSLTNVVVPTTSQITGIGFELPGTILAVSPGVCSGSCNNFGLAPTVNNSPGNVPQFNAAVLDWAITTGPNFAGGNPPGIMTGQTATFTVTASPVGGFGALTQANFLNGAYVRWQVVGPEGGSDVGHNPVPTPEPASVLLLGIGLLAVAARRIRR